MDADFIQSMDEIVAAVRSAGYDPYEQLLGYMQTGELFYITRQDGARDKITLLDQRLIRQYVETMLRSET